MEVGVSYLHFDEYKIKNFIKNLDRYRKKLASYNPGSQKEILKQIENEIKELIYIDFWFIMKVIKIFFH